MQLILLLALQQTVQGLFSLVFFVVFFLFCVHVSFAVRCIPVSVLISVIVFLKTYSEISYLMVLFNFVCIIEGSSSFHWILLIVL